MITAFQAAQLTVLGAASDSNRILRASCEAAAAEDDFCYVQIPSRREDELLNRLRTRGFSVRVVSSDKGWSNLHLSWQRLQGRFI